MTDEDLHDPSRPRPTLSEQVGAKATRKIKARRHAGQSVWFGLGMMGLVGWTVMIPTLIGAALGRWIDKHHPGVHHWTLALLVAGMVIGCVSAWYWVAKEERAIGREQEDDDE